MAASKRDMIQAGIDESERELMDLAFIIGPMKRYLERLDEASRINADLTKALTKGRTAGRLRRHLGGARVPLPYQTAGRHVRDATKTLRPVLTELTKRHAAAAERRSKLRSRLRHL